MVFYNKKWLGIDDWSQGDFNWTKKTGDKSDGFGIGFLGFGIWYSLAQFDYNWTMG